MRFSTLIGQSPVRQHLQNAIRNNTVSHAYLITGEAGMGKRTVARLFAQTLQCTDLREEGGLIEPCGKCTACLQAMNDTHPDIRTITSDKPTGIGVGDVREQIVEDAFLMPYAGTRKVYLVPDAEKMTTEAQNALLKTLEEPPAYVTILLLTANENAFLPTILSRVVTLPLKPVPDAQVQSYLMERMHVPDYAARLAVRFARGNIGRAGEYATGGVFEERLSRTMALLKDLDRTEISRMNALTQEILTVKAQSEEAQAVSSKKEKTAKKALEREGAEAFLEILTALLRDILVYKASAREDLLIFADEMSYISRACDVFSYADLARTEEDLLHAAGQLRANGNTALILQLLLMNLKERMQYT